MEEWRDVKGYAGVYKVSNYGNVKRLARTNRCKQDRLLVLKTKKTGYKFVCLSVNSEYKYFHVHRLVAESFIPKEIGKDYVNHKDMNKANNTLSNLEWVTARENNKHARENKKFKNGNKKGIEHHKALQIMQKDTSGNVVFLWGDTGEIVNTYKISITCIQKACRLNTKAIGYFWQYTSKDFYLENKDNFKEVPPVLVHDLRARDLTKARESKIKNLSLFTNDFLVDVGCRCFQKYGRIIRKEYDIFAKENKSLTYTPTVKRFGSWDNFKKHVSNNLLSKIQLPC